MLQRELEDFPEMQPYAFLVNDVLGTNIPNNVVTDHRSRYTYTAVLRAENILTWFHTFDANGRAKGGTLQKMSGRRYIRTVVRENPVIACWWSKLLPPLSP